MCCDFFHRFLPPFLKRVILFLLHEIRLQKETRRIVKILREISGTEKLRDEKSKILLVRICSRNNENWYVDMNSLKKRVRSPSSNEKKRKANISTRGRPARARIVVIIVSASEQRWSPRR